jgi:DHA1 family tetracycline resistance protein-like MFS transporter
MRAPALVAAGLVLSNAGLVLSILPESLPAERRSHDPLRGQLNPVASLGRSLAHTVLRVPLVAMFVANCAFAGFQTNFAIHVGEDFGFGPGELGSLFFGLGLTSIVVQGLVLRRLSRRFADHAILVLGLVVSSCGYVLVGGVPTAGLLWPGLVVLSAGRALWRAPLSSLISKLVDPREQGRTNGASQAMASLGSIVGPIAAGLGYERLSPSAPYVVAAVRVGMCAILVLPGRAQPAAARVGSLSPHRRVATERSA